MKRLVILIILVAFFSKLFALDSTRTIAESDFSTIQYGCENDNLISYYYQQLLDIKDEEEIIYDELGKGETFGTNTYMKRAFLGVLMFNNLTDARYLYYLTHMEYNKYFG